MKKSTLLSLLTAGSIVLTSAGTYAAWDKTSANDSTTVAFRTPVTISVTDNVSLSKDQGTLKELPTVSGSVKLVVTDPDNLATKLKLTPEVEGYADASANDFDFIITDKGDTNRQLKAEEGSTVIIDNSPKSADYGITVKPKKNLSEQKLSAIADNTLTIKLAAELTND